MRILKLTPVFALFCFLFACDESEDVKEVDVSDADAVTVALDIEGATVVEGNPPAPSTSASAPSIYEYQYSQQAKIGAGGNVGLDINVYQGDIAGVYLQVQGAGSYLDVPFSALNGSSAAIEASHVSRLLRTQEDYFSLIIPIPESLTSGEICVDYCVYNAEQEVSNIVTRCIEIVAPGGENSSFFHGKWEATKIIEVYDGEVYEEEIGVEYEYEYDAYIYCDGSYTEVAALESYLEKYFYLTFGSNGGLEYASEYEYTEVDYENSDCEVEYYTETEKVEGNGVWAYDDDNKWLTLAFEIKYSDSEEEYIENIAVEGEIELDGDLLVFTEYDPDYPADSYSIYFKKR